MQSNHLKCLILTVTLIMLFYFQSIAYILVLEKVRNKKHILRVLNKQLLAAFGCFLLLQQATKPRTVTPGYTGNRNLSLHHTTKCKAMQTRCQWDETSLLTCPRCWEVILGSPRHLPQPKHTPEQKERSHLLHCPAALPHLMWN